MEALITSRQLAEYLNLKTHTVREWTRRGELPCVRIGTVVRYRLSEVMRHLEPQAK